MPIELVHQTAIRWNDPAPELVPLLKEGGITLAVVAAPDEGFAKACAAAGIQVVAGKDVELVNLADAGKARPGALAAFKAGLWPGVHRQDPQVAGATRSLWMDQNCSLVSYLRAMFPHLPPVLAYLPDKDGGVSPDQVVNFDSLELALAEAWVAGGNCLSGLHSEFRKALIAGTPEALAAWRKLGTTARWLRANEPLFRQPLLPTVTILVDGGDFALEIVHLSYRHNVSPAVALATDPPAPDPARRRVMVAIGIDAPQGEARKRILANAEAGSALVVDSSGEGAWWRVAGLKLQRSDAEREFYSLGKGQVVAYKGDIQDPGMFALDVIDILTQKLRPARIWNCNGGLAMATLAPRAGSVTGTAALHVINYGRPVDLPVLARILGNFKTATVLRPEAEPIEVRVAPRGPGSEVAIPRLERVATVVFR